jgi:hypothetical protein
METRISSLACTTRRVAVIWIGLALTAQAQDATNRTIAGELIVEPPTLISLGFEWYIEGDADRDATVEVSYRESGAAQWHEALPLLRIDNERLPLQFGMPDFISPNLFAGSILDLNPDTQYAVQLRLNDPDGVSGQSTRILSVRTRAEPAPAEDGRVFHVYTDDWDGPKQEPAYTGLYDAYYVATIVGGDHYNAFPARVQPGDTILVHAGVYKDDRLDYGHELDPARRCCGTTWDGTYYLTASGTAARPIAIVAAGDGEVVFDGDGNHTLFNLMAGNYHYFDGITFRNTDIAIEAGQKDIAGSSGLTVKYSRFEDVGVGVHTDWSGSKNFYIADNVFIGRNNRDYLVPFRLDRWRQQYPGLVERFPENVNYARSQYAVKVYGSGHVVAHNTIRHFHDGVDFATYGPPQDYPNTPRDRMPVSNDFYNNDVFNSHDDCIEVDGSLFNIRVLRNRCINMAGSGLSMQILYAGPGYFIRNIVYNSVGANWALKFSGSSGGIFYHNTLFATVTGANIVNNHFRNNFILANRSDMPAMNLATYTSYTTSDFNGFRAGEAAPYLIAWRSPIEGVMREYEREFAPREFTTISSYARATGNDRNSIVVNFDDFRSVPLPDESRPDEVVSQEGLDFRLAQRSRAVDAGDVLPNVNDDYAGNAPDLGALESGQALPVYGPRTR